MTTIAPPALAFRVLSARTFAAECAWVARRVPGRPQVPALGGILLRTTDAGLTLSAFDYETVQTATVDVLGDTGGVALVSGRLLAEWAKTLPDKALDARIDGTVLRVSCGSATATLPLMPADDYPALPNPPRPIGTVDARTLCEAIERVAVAADPGSALAKLTGVYLHLAADRIDLMATDSYRGTIATVPWTPVGPDTDDGTDVGTDVDALALATALADGGRAFDGADAITLSLADGLIGLSSPGRSIITRLIADTFPAPQMRKVVPGVSATPAEVHRAGLIAAVRRVELFKAVSTSVWLTFTADTVTLGAAGVNEGAEGGETLDCRYAGPEITVKFNPTYLLDALTASRGETVAFSMTEPAKAVLLTGTDPDTYRHMVQPIRKS